MPVIIDDRTFSERGYLAPTVYRLAGGPNNWNYYRTKEDAINKWLYLNNQGGVNVPAYSYYRFTPDGQAQTFGINVDFYYKVSGFGWLPLSYSYIRQNYSRLANGLVFRFYLTDGSGPYWAIMNSAYFGIAATVTSETNPDKIAALDSFQREITLMKYRYNNLAAFLNDLSKRVLKPTEQQIFNQGVLLLNNMRSEISQIDGIEITFTKEGTIGLPVFLIIGVIAILASATAWTVSTIYTEKEKTRRINESYELTRWVTSKKVEVAQLATAGTITQSQAADINKTLDNATAVANKVAKDSSKPSTGLFGDITNLIKWGVYGVLAWTGYKIVTQNKPANVSK